jgi:NADH dehydrogenase [ubiquinone] 1 alpha subcomplex assembly factor 5
MAQSPDTAKPFDRTAVRRHRDRSAKDFDRHAFLFDEVGNRLLDRLADIRRPFPRVLELGCRDGRLTQNLKSIGEEIFVRADFSEAMCRAADAGHGGTPTLAADEELLPFADASFDLIVSNLALHWVNDLPGALAQIRRALRPDGLLLASMLGGDTLGELRASLLAADVSVSDGAGPRVSPFCDVRDAAHLLSRAGLALPVADVDRIDVTYKDALSLMRELRGMGEANAVLVRQRNFTRRATIAAACAHYAKEFAATDDADRIRASFEVIYLAAWNPHPSQQKPLRPGEATTRLADALGSHEEPAGDPARPKTKP